MRKQSNLHLPVVFADTKPLISFDDMPTPMELKIYDVSYLHFHRDLELGLCISGEGICQVEDTQFPFTAGDIQVIFPYQRHLSMNSGDTPSVWYWVNIDIFEILSQAGFTVQEQIQQWLHNEMGLCGIINKNQYSIICQTVKKIFQFLHSAPGSVLHPKEAFANTLMEFVLQLCEASRDLPKLTLRTGEFAAELTPALDKINADIRSGCIPKVTDLPALCSMSPANFHRVFLKTLGLTPKAYITQCCIHKAKKLLACTTLSVVEIAEQVGYENISGFNRCFLAKTGISPTTFRKQMHM